MIGQMKHLCVLLPLLLLPLRAWAAGAAVPDPQTCAGYPEQRWFIDAQAWWTRMSGQTGKDFGHVHTALCFPLRQVVRGTTPLDIRVTMHMNPGRLETLTVQIGGSGQYVAAKKKFSPALTCAEECVWWFHLDMNTSGFSNDGWQEVRIRPKITEPDGNQLVGSTSYQVYLANGKKISNYRPPDFMQGKGWYTKTGYAQARMTAGFPFDGPVSGAWTVQLGCDSSDQAVTGCLVTIDPHFHELHEGQVLFRSNRAWKGSLTIDTTRLAPGPHKLVIRSDVADSRGSTLSGIYGIPFVVRN